VLEDVCIPGASAVDTVLSDCGTSAVLPLTHRASDGGATKKC
jgi:hypothetical protein